MRIGSHERSEATIPTASMADIAFLLIIFFLTATIFSIDKGLRIALPEPQEKVVIKSENMIKIDIDAEGLVTVDNEPVALEDIREVVTGKLEERPEAVITIRTHPQSAYENMINVFDELKLANATRISFAPGRRQSEEGG
ncbi:hypothetical protein AMJ39_00475 [candidate division TA06 bacterium DG_24]|jgi:biopolymer transport protein ExbD|uniref:Biopolymer transporter ExbD n=3 Tax=Bacteria division TA06 TaxID=1156500 RepID=A0A0S8JKQ1_UNCT6|nr:MAG: hypothetical protein AMJ39_00475 [candidate division TA06 bacterium DG_24]KPK67374.1 MAG: hypothetical protein AMJ82_10760 [candidate division TA06 bacterium SM23_40]KPL09179.1 MAG: hypothetical protein AMJ71_07080 [candidate division TA06 bacterium SM1_40]